LVVETLKREKHDAGGKFGKNDRLGDVKRGVNRKIARHSILDMMISF
jgi:hypothetical protein